VDAGEYGKSWDEAAPRFRSAVSRADWEKAVRGARAPYGTLLSRRTRAAIPQTSLPGAGEGHYVVVQTDASFEHKKSATETCAMELATDGRWRLAGYFIR
jgi:hypothetical protein